jgi:hypothetical protein
VHFIARNMLADHAFPQGNAVGSSRHAALASLPRIARHATAAIALRCPTEPPALSDQEWFRQSSVVFLRNRRSIFAFCTDLKIRSMTMKSVFALFATLGLSLMIFIGGLAAATFLLHAGETPSRLGGSNVASLWTNEPVRIDPAHNTFERLPAIAMASEVPASGPDGEPIAALPSTRGGADEGKEMVHDVALTATEATGADAQSAPAMNEAHLDWCSNRYRSYRPRDNSYTAYSGGRRECASPFPTHAAETVAANDTISPMPDRHDSFAEDNFPESASQAALEPQVEQASLEGASGFVTAEHAQSCSARYRSYSAEDNTYQPYGGGPRVQCQ